MENELGNMRENYSLGTFDFDNAYPSPFQQFEKWFEDAASAKINEPNAMVLSTASLSGIPSSRVVLLKGFSNDGFVFFTNYDSRKGKEIAQNPNACLNFWWGKLERQVRIEGKLEKLTAAESDAYFYSRPVGSQAGAATSPQSEVIQSREWLEKQFIEIQIRGDIKRPENWGGYLLRPSRLEFWQGRTNRLHDRLLYTKQETGWSIVRLAP